MKSKASKEGKKVSRVQVMQSALASFKIEGIHIPKEKAVAILKKVELSLGK